MFRYGNFFVAQVKSPENRKTHAKEGLCFWVQVDTLSIWQAAKNLHKHALSTCTLARWAMEKQDLNYCEVTSTQVSRAAKELDQVLDQWRKRSLGAYPYVYLDARYEKVRHNGSVVDVAVLVAIGVAESGHRQILGTSIALSEQEAHWRDFLSTCRSATSMVSGYLSGCPRRAQGSLERVVPSVPWQRCQFHLQQNAQAYVPKQEMKKTVAADIRSIFTAPTALRPSGFWTLLEKESFETGGAEPIWIRYFPDHQTSERFGIHGPPDCPHSFWSSVRGDNLC